MFLTQRIPLEFASEEYFVYRLTESLNLTVVLLQHGKFVLRYTLWFAGGTRLKAPIDEKVFLDTLSTYLDQKSRSTMISPYDWRRIVIECAMDWFLQARQYFCIFCTKIDLMGKI